MGSAEQTGLDPRTRARILDAAFDCAREHGLGRTTMNDVARAARLSRMTLYRYFPSKHDLFAALVLREEEGMAAAVREATRPHTELRPALEVAFATALRLLREHPLLDRVMATEPQELLPFLTVESNPVLSLGMRLMEQVIAPRATGASPVVVHRAAETCARVFVSYAITPPADDPDEVSGALAELICNGLGKQERKRKR